MTPELLAKYLDTLKDRGVMHAAVSFDNVVLNVTFGPEAAPMPGDAPTPGGWKSPARLDAPEQFEEMP